MKKKKQKQQQRIQTGQQTSSAQKKQQTEQQTRLVQKQQTGQRKQSLRQSESQIPQRQKRDWRAYLYNCPYLILITLTTLAVMFISDEIGISAAVRDTQMFVSRSYAKMPGEQGMLEAGSHSSMLEENGKTSDIENLNKVGDEDAVKNGKDAADIGNTDGIQTSVAAGIGDGSEAESFDEESEVKAGNAGIRKDNSNDLQNDDRHQSEHSGLKNGVDTEDLPKGVTDFEFYEPLQIESRYYKDAGKVALTTVYPYTKENTSYFDDAAFLGDSRTLGISDYAGLENTDFYCDSGMTIFRILEDEVTYQKTGSKVRMTEVLQTKQYGKIYIMLGMNELGYGDTEMYLDQYQQVLQQIREWQPEAVIYIMANLHVSREKNNMETEFNNININDKNAASASLANGTDVFYLDVNPVFTDEEGYLKSELTFDGVHLYAKHYDAWREFLLEHAVDLPKSQISEAEQRTDTGSGIGKAAQENP